MQKRFPLAALSVLLVGLIVIAGIILSSFSSASIFFTVRTVNSVEQAKDLADQYLSRLNLELEVREIMEFSNHFYVIVQEKSTGINAFELLVDKRTGTIFSEPGPNMMWNTKYGHMRRVSNATTAMPLNGQEASEYAQRWRRQKSFMDTTQSTSQKMAKQSGC